MTFAELYGWVKTRFDTEGQRSRYKAELNARKRKKGETLQSLSSDIARLMGMAYKGEKSTHRDDMGADKFLAALDDEELKLKVMECEPKNLDEAVKHAQRFESYRASAEGANVDNQARGRIRDNYQARAVNNRSGNSTGATNRADHNNDDGVLAKLVQSDENTQNEIRNLKSLSESTYKAVQAIGQGLSSMQVRTAPPTAAAVSPVAPIATAGPTMPPPSFYPGAPLQGPPQVNTYGYPFSNIANGSVPQTGSAGYVNNPSAGPSVG